MLAEVLQLADIVRSRLEDLGHDLGAGRCFHRAIGIAASARAMGIPLTLCLGVTRYAASPDDEFHAWAELGHRAIAAGRDVGGYAVLIRL
jgi:hypothetical protein